MKKIEVGYVAVKDQLFFYHKYLIYTDSNNNQQLLEVKPTNTSDDPG